MSEMSIATLRAEVGAWIDAHWDPDMTVGEWWDILGPSGYAHPTLPVNAYGKGWDRARAAAVFSLMAERGVLGPPTGLGRMLAASTIAAHGSPKQINEFIPPILDGRVGWCQLFSEPGAGSDLAGLTTKADKDGDTWIVNGQKVWTSGGRIADMGMLIARTDPDAPKHMGITWFAFDMNQTQVTVRPLVEMTGSAMFNEVFIDDARVPDANIIGEVNHGWSVANTTLAFERASLGSSGRNPVGVSGGSKAGARSRPVRDFLDRVGGEAGIPPVGMQYWKRLWAMATKNGRVSDPVLRDDLVRLWSLIEVNRISMIRTKDPKQRTGAEPNIAKLMVSEMFRRSREVGNSVVGPCAMLIGADDHESDGVVAYTTMFSPGPSIYGGTDQIQRNIIGERVLGLPREPGPPRETPFVDLPRN